MESAVLMQALKSGSLNGTSKKMPLHCFQEEHFCFTGYLVFSYLIEAQLNLQRSTSFNAWKFN